MSSCTTKSRTSSLFRIKSPNSYNVSILYSLVWWQKYFWKNIECTLSWNLKLEITFKSSDIDNLYSLLNPSTISPSCFYVRSTLSYDSYVFLVTYKAKLDILVQHYIWIIYSSEKLTKYTTLSLGFYSISLAELCFVSE